MERGDEIQRIDMIDKDSLVIIITVRARKELLDPLIENIAAQGSQILLLTMNKDYRNELVDYIYCIEGTESQYTESSLQGTMNF